MADFDSLNEHATRRPHENLSLDEQLSNVIDSVDFLQTRHDAALKRTRARTHDSVRNAL